MDKIDGNDRLIDGLDFEVPRKLFDKRVNACLCVIYVENMGERDTF